MDTDPAANAPEWAPERVVSAAAARELIGARHPELRDAPVEPLATGWDNTVFRVGEEWIFRFPRRSLAVPGVEREIAVLPGLAGRLPLPIPRPEFVGRPSERFPWPFWGARMLPGTELAETGPAGDARTGVAADLGGFLAALHEPGLVRAAGAGLPHDPMRRADPGVRAPRARRELAALAGRGVREPDPALEAFLADAERADPPAGPPVLSHGDLHVRHVLAGPDAGGTVRATGVIDWGDVCLADPVVDLSLAYAGFAGPARTALLTAYGRPPSPARETAARVLAISLCAVLAGYAAATGRARLLAESLAGIDRAAPA